MGKSRLSLPVGLERWKNLPHEILPTTQRKALTRVIRVAKPRAKKGRNKKNQHKGRASSTRIGDALEIQDLPR
jgi:hypothetical protein